MMKEYAAGEEEVHLEPQSETTSVVEPERQGEEQIPAQKGKKQRRTKQSRAKRAEDFEDDKSFFQMNLILYGIRT